MSRNEDRKPNNRRLRRIIRGTAVVACTAFGGCAGVWDDVTSRDFHAKAIFSRPDPMTVLRDSNDGDARAKALSSLKEPRRNNGSNADQEEMMRILTNAAIADPQPLCRMAAIQTLGTFQDPRAVQALMSAYESAGQYQNEVAEALQGRALASLGDIRQPSAIGFLVQVSAKRPNSEQNDRERQQSRNTRLAAVRALKSYERSTEVANAMAQIMQTEKDVAIRDRARETYVKVTGTEPPGDGVAAPVPAQSPSAMQLTGGMTGR